MELPTIETLIFVAYRSFLVGFVVSVIMAEIITRTGRK